MKLRVIHLDSNNRTTRVGLRPAYTNLKSTPLCSGHVNMVMFTLTVFECLSPEMPVAAQDTRMYGNTNGERGGERAQNNRERVGVSLTKDIGKSYLVIVLVDR